MQNALHVEIIICNITINTVLLLDELRRQMPWTAIPICSMNVQSPFIWLA